MPRFLLHVSALLALTAVAILPARSPTPPGSQASPPFAGRWEVVVRPPSAGGETMEMPFFIVEIASGATGPTAKLVDSMGSPALTMTVASLSVKDDTLTLVVEMAGVQTITFTGKRVGDRLEGTARADRDPEPATWTGQATTKDKLAAPRPPEPSADQKAYSEVLRRPAAERVAALTQFLADHPDSPLKERASLALAQAPTNRDERMAALRAFIAAFPNGTLREQAYLDIAMAPILPADRAAGLRKFIEDFPSSRLREQADYSLIATLATPAERLAAEEAFLTAYPKSVHAGTIQRNWFESLLREKPVNGPRLAAVIAQMIEAAPDRALPAGQYTRNQRASVMNTIADRLMDTGVLLERALDIIDTALSMAGEKEDPQSRAMYTTTRGQVLFKLKRYDEAGEALKQAVAISGRDGSAETQLYLGKFYEVKGDDDAALAAYLKSTENGSPLDTKASLERLYLKKHGTLSTLEDTLDVMYRAKPRPFDPGRFAPAAPRAEPSRVVLAELFTGAECAPCVASDLAFDGLAERFDRRTLAVLVYHLHIPGPDPMTNADTEARAKYYGVNATPTAVIDGLSPRSGGGGEEQAARVFNEYTGRIEARLDTTPLATLSGFRATMTAGTITVSGQAGVATASGSRAVRAMLRVALVEDAIRYVGSNRVRFHNLVVRKLIGTPDGVPIGVGEAVALNASVTLADVEADLTAYLEKYEQDRSTRAPFTFKERLNRLNAGQIRVVAFVQDDQTKEVLQAVIVDIEKTAEVGFAGTAKSNATSEVPLSAAAGRRP